jgi:Calcineurin-like phosphoesterase
MSLFRRSDIFEPPTLLERIFSSPLKYLISLLYRFTNTFRSARRKPQSPIRVVCISDTHCQTCPIPDGDLLIHAGDLANKGNIAEIQGQIEWISGLPHKHKVVIAGNHDTYLDPRSRKTLSTEDQSGSLDWKGIQYLQHNSVTLTFSSENAYPPRKLTVYGAPQIPKCGGAGFAFQYPRGQDAWTYTIPRDTDILVTHTPPKYHRDLFTPSLGCEWLLKEVWRVQPRLHVCGHCHVGAGKEVLYWDDTQAAYERACARRTDGFLAEVFSPWLWIDALEVLLYGASGVIWDRIWGGAQRQTVLVNASLMLNNTGKLVNSPHVVDV